MTTRAAGATIEVLVHRLVATVSKPLHLTVDAPQAEIGAVDHINPAVASIGIGVPIGAFLREDGGVMLREDLGLLLREQ